MNKLTAGCIAEFLGTFALTFFGCLAIILTTPAHGGAGALITVALAHALILFAFISGCMYISGAQFNPAVSIGLIFAGKQSPAQAAAFIVTQILGAACAVGMINVILGPGSVRDANNYMIGSTIGKLTMDGAVFPLLLLEAILTFALMFVILTSTVDDRAHKMAGLPIGLTVGACILAAGPLSGASMNPARTFGPWMYGQHPLLWVYFAGPITGAILAALVYRAVWPAQR